MRQRRPNTRPNTPLRGLTKTTPSVTVRYSLLTDEDTE